MKDVRPRALPLPQHEQVGLTTYDAPMRVATALQ
jgi:hypothetical protein